MSLTADQIVALIGTLPLHEAADLLGVTLDAMLSAPPSVDVSDHLVEYSAEDRRVALTSPGRRLA